MNYGELKTAVQSRLDRPDEVAAVAVCIEAATARLSRLLRIYEQEGISDATLTSEYTAMPADFNGMRSLAADGKQLDYRPPQLFQSVVAVGSTPAKRLFTIEIDSLRVYPAPSPTDPLSVSMLYSRKLSALVADADTNEVLDEHPDLYLAAVMSEVMLHMKNYDTHAVWDNRVAQVGGEVLVASRRKRFDSGNLTIRRGA